MPSIRGTPQFTVVVEVFLTEELHGLGVPTQRSGCTAATGKEIAHASFTSRKSKKKTQEGRWSVATEQELISPSHPNPSFWKGFFQTGTDTKQQK
jgi:hypothetical protein